MNRAERRRYAKTINTPQKLENYGIELEKRIRQELVKQYDKIYEKDTLNYFKNLGLLFTYVIEYELEKEDKIRVTARKTKDMMPKISEAVLQIVNSVMEHLNLIDHKQISLDDIENYLKEECGIEWKW